VRIDIPGRRVDLVIEPQALEARRTAMRARGAEAWTPRGRNRTVSQALQAYARLTTSAARGAVRDLDQLAPRST
jgi:dihydroxy-acid dehydratase